MIPEFAKNIFKRSQHIKTGVLIAQGLRMKYRLSKGEIEVDSGNAHKAFNPQESIDYIEEVFNDYKQYLQIESFSGKVAEIGPGDNAGVALLMRADGSKEIDLIDRFFCKRDAKQQNKIYTALSKNYKLEDYRNGQMWDDQSLKGIVWNFGDPAEVFFKKCADKQGPTYDYIVSRAVFEHLYNPLDALRYNVACLKSGGKLAHKVDLRDHGNFTPHLHELTFLKISSRYWPTISKHTGGPNRILTHRYRELLEKLNETELSDYSILVTRLVGVGEITPHQKFEDIDLNLRKKALDFVEKHRKSLAKDFRDVEAQDLAISGIFITAQKN